MILIIGGINNPDGDSDKSSNSSKEEKPKEPKTWWKRDKIWTLATVSLPVIIGVIITVMGYLFLNDNRDIRDYTKQQTGHSTRNLGINEDLKGYSKDNTETNKQRLEVQRKTLHNNVEIEQEQLIDNANRAATQVLLWENPTNYTSEPRSEVSFPKGSSYVSYSQPQYKPNYTAPSIKVEEIVGEFERKLRHSGTRGTSREATFTTRKEESF